MSGLISTRELYHKRSKSIKTTKTYVEQNDFYFLCDYVLGDINVFLSLLT